MSKESEVVKTRLLLRRAERKQAEELPALEAAIYELRREVERAEQAYGDALEADGLCRWCELPKNVCEGHVGAAMRCVPVTGSAGEIRG